jgi:nicotinamidase-related amidase
MGETKREFPIPDFFQPERAGELWPVPYAYRAQGALEYRRRHQVAPAATDTFRTALLLIDVQNTFCLPTGELFVGGPSGQGAVEDNRRLAEFIYRHLPRITEIICTLDTHQFIQIFHPVFWVDAAGDHPLGGRTIISADQVESGFWKVNPALATDSAHYQELQRHALFYTKRLAESGKFPLMIWPYHAVLGGVGHALVPLIEEAAFFHGAVRQTSVRMELKGFDRLTENYSVLGPEVSEDAAGKLIGKKNAALFSHLLGFDAVFIAGQAKSHCVAWTVADLLQMVLADNAGNAAHFHLLEDCTSPVVIPGVVDFSREADKAFQGFSRAGMRLVKTTTPWPERKSAI